MFWRKPEEILAKSGAGNGNRTRVSTLGRSHTAIVLYPQIKAFSILPYFRQLKKARTGFSCPRLCPMPYSCLADFWNRKGVMRPLSPRQLRPFLCHCLQVQADKAICLGRVAHARLVDFMKCVAYPASRTIFFLNGYNHKSSFPDPLPNRPVFQSSPGKRKTPAQARIFKSVCSANLSLARQRTSSSNRNLQISGIP